jgi:hypothetical protein
MTPKIRRIAARGVCWVLLASGWALLTLGNGALWTAQRCHIWSRWCGFATIRVALWGSEA